MEKQKITECWTWSNVTTPIGISAEHGFSMSRQNPPFYWDLWILEAAAWLAWWEQRRMTQWRWRWRWRWGDSGGGRRGWQGRRHPWKARPGPSHLCWVGRSALSGPIVCKWITGIKHALTQSQSCTFSFNLSPFTALVVDFLFFIFKNSYFNMCLSDLVAVCFLLQCFFCQNSDVCFISRVCDCSCCYSWLLYF